MAPITRRSHPLAKRVRALHLAKRRSESGLYVIEGVKVVSDAIAAAAPIVDVIISPRLDRDAAGRACHDRLRQCGSPVHETTDDILSHIAHTVSQQGVVAVARKEPTPLTTLLAPLRHPVVVVAVGLQDPGNIGALMRTADALDAPAIVVCDDCVDPWSPKAVRAAAGSSFRIAIAASTAVMDVVVAAQSAGYRVAASVARGGVAPDPQSLAGPVALLVGSEGCGLSEAVTVRADVRVSIELRRPTESLNVAVAAGVLLYSRRRPAQI